MPDPGGILDRRCTGFHQLSHRALLSRSAEVRADYRLPYAYSDSEMLTSHAKSMLLDALDPNTGMHDPFPTLYAHTRKYASTMKS